MTTTNMKNRKSSTTKNEQIVAVDSRVANARALIRTTICSLLVGVAALQTTACQEVEGPESSNLDDALAVEPEFPNLVDAEDEDDAPDSYIFGGTNTSSSTIMAFRIVKPDFPNCTATLIGGDHWLTAAHCVAPHPPGGVEGSPLADGTSVSVAVKRFDGAAGGWIEETKTSKV